MKYRSHRGTLTEAMKTVAELEPTIEAIANHTSYPKESLKVKPYIFDRRINWNTHIVTLNGYAIGFTDGPVN